MTLMTVSLPLPLGRSRLLTPFLAIAEFIRKVRAERQAREAECHQKALRLARTSAEALERARPGSVAQLNEQSIDIASNDICALAQIYGHYESAPVVLRSLPVVDGFRVPPGLATYHMNAAWRTVIEEYRAAA